MQLEFMSPLNSNRFTYSAYQVVCLCLKVNFAISFSQSVMQLMIQLPGLQMLGLECKSLHFGVLREMFFFWFFFFRYTTSN